MVEFNKYKDDFCQQESMARIKGFANGFCNDAEVRLELKK